jgi:putative SOS response-associated peptidase YedK
MCGRFVRKGQTKNVAKNLGVATGEENWTESYNVAPSAIIPIVTADPNGRHLVSAIWGFASTGRAPLFNAKGGTVDSLPSFRDAFRSNRCLVPASGFYEWRPRDKQPFYFERVDGQLLAFAGICKWVGNHLQATVITTAPSPDISDIHHRMPVILSEKSWDGWLAPHQLSKQQRIQFLAPAAPNTLKSWTVSRSVGNVRNNDRDLILPFHVPPTEETQELFQ